MDYKKVYKSLNYEDPVLEYPEYTPIAKDGTFLLLDPSTFPHPSHRDPRYSDLVLSVFNDKKKFLPSKIKFIEVRQIKGSEETFVIGLNRLNNPIPTDQHLLEEIEADQVKVFRSKAKNALLFLLSQNTTVSTAFSSYLGQIKTGNPAILKDYFERMVGVPGESEQDDSADLGSVSDEEMVDFIKNNQ